MDTPEKRAQLRDWINFWVTLSIPVLIFVFTLYVKNQRLEISAEMARLYVPIELYREAQKANEAQIAAMSAKIDRLTISVTRLTDAVKLRDP